MSATTTGAERLASLLREARSVVALTGAGISTPSGIPDFRSPGTGLWEKVDPMQIATIDAFRADPERFWGFYADRFTSLKDKQPNGAHHALVELERRGVVRAVITQNVDMLHRKAGTEELIEVHGSIASSSCLVCRSTFELDVARQRVEAAEDGVPRCDCGEPLKPDVVLFGEMLPERAMQRAFALAGVADVMLCVGSSLEVYPVAGLPQVTMQTGGQVAIVTKGPTPYDGDAAVKLDGDVVAELEAVVAAL